MEQRKYDVQIVPVIEVAKLLGTDAMKVKSGILNGTLPIGCVLSCGKNDRTIIIEERLKRWLKGEL